MQIRNNFPKFYGETKMPLMQGKAKRALSYNIKKELKSGKPRKQAIAIALSAAGKSKKKKSYGR